MRQFEYLWEKAVKNALANVWEELPEAEKKEFNITRRDSKDDMEKVKSLYENNRNMIKRRFFDSGEDGNNLIDVHKIASCLTAALVSFKMIKYDSKEGASVGLLLSNYAVAFLAGINVLYLVDLSDTCEKRPDIYKELVKKKTFVFPETTLGHDPYVQGRIKTLAVNDINGIDFDILTYADMLFWIEKYNYDMLSSVASQ